MIAVFVQNEFGYPTELLVLGDRPLVYGGYCSKPFHSLLGQLVLVLPVHFRPVFCSSLLFISSEVERSNSQIWDLNMRKAKGLLSTTLKQLCVSHQRFEPGKVLVAPSTQTAVARSPACSEHQHSSASEGFIWVFPNGLVVA